MASTPGKRYVPAPPETMPLPIAVESLGYNPSQEKVARPNGYPVFHWLQTARGEGTIAYGGRALRLPPHTGVLLFPGVPHSYEMTGDGWETAYLTFGGPAAGAILLALGIGESDVYRWHAAAPPDDMIASMLAGIERDGDIFGLNLSAEAYRFLLALARYGARDGRIRSGAARLDKLRELIGWMEAHYADPSIGLREIAAVLGVSGRRLNGMFQETLGLSPYRYLIQLRIRKAKELLVASRTLTVREIAELVGFNDASHFVATFRRQTGMPPEQFRRLH